MFFSETDLNDMDCYLPKDTILPEIETEDESELESVVLGLIGLAILGLLIIGFVGASSKSVEEE